jgi:hypothetical protein
MDDKRAVFNEQMNEWVSRQGLWFQLRHAADGQSIVSRLARLGLRLIILLVLCALIFWVYLVRRVGKDEFKEDVRASIEETLRGKECAVGSIRRDRNIATISHIEMEGTDKSFFHQLSAGMLRLNMKLTDGFVGVWNGGGVSINRLDISLKSGASTDSSAAEAYQAIFAEHQSFEFEWLEVQKTSLSWGYSSNNRGAIRDSHMTAARDGDGWRLEFKGGTFSQNWIRHYEIGKMTVVCDDLGVHIKEAELLADGGSLTFQVEVGAGGQPEALGSVVINSMPMKSLLPYRFSEWVEGRISGKGTVSGSTNSQKGIALDLKLSLEDGDELILRDSLPLLSALSVVDVYNSYRKIEFTEGSCQIRTGGDQLHVDDIHFMAGDLFVLKGNVEVRPPNHAEIAKALDIEDVRVVTDIIEKNWKIEDEILDAADSKLSLSDSAKRGGEVTVAATGEKALSEIAVLTTAVLTEKNVRRFGGSVKVGLKGDAFDKALGLKKAYPVDSETGRIWLDVPLSGRLQTLTLEQAKTLYILGRNRR